MVTKQRFAHRASSPGVGQRLLGKLDRLLGAVVRFASLLVLPLALLLFLQWPLREVVQAYSREANDLGQILFAIYVGLAITAATRENGHLATDALSRRFRERTRRRLKRIASLLLLVPWAIFVLWSAWPATWQSVLGLEGFSETYNPGFFIIKAMVVVLALAVLLQALIDAFKPLPDAGR